MAWTRLRKDIEASTLRIAAKKETNAGMSRRLLGIAHLLEGGTREEAHKIACLTINIFRIWMKRFNESGIEGLRSKKSTGRPPKISKEIKEELKKKILDGPDKRKGLVRYRIVDLQNMLKENYDIKIGSSGLWYILQELDLTWKTGRQRHPKSATDTQETFKKTLKTK